MYATFLFFLFIFYEVGVILFCNVYLLEIFRGSGKKKKSKLEVIVLEYEMYDAENKSESDHHLTSENTFYHKFKHFVCSFYLLVL